jgi:hypothetical protein
MVIGAIFLIFGVLSIILSIFLSSQILTFIGLGVTFWGAIFILVTPQKRFEGSFLETVTVPEYMTIDRILTDLNSRGEAYCIPPLSKNINLPEHLTGFKKMAAYIPAAEATGELPIEELGKGHFQIERPKGVLITPPGFGIIDRLEQKRDTIFEKITIDELMETLPKLLNDFSFAKEISMARNENEITLKVVGSLYKNLYSKKYDLRSVFILGCPIINAAACAIAKSSGKLVSVKRIDISPIGNIITSTYTIIQS